MNKAWRNYIFHPLFISFIISVIAIFFIVKYVPSYRTEVVQNSIINNNGKIYYYDLDNDGNSEKIHYYHYDQIFEPTLYLYDSDDNFKFLWNFFESPIKDNDIYVGVFNNDLIKELFVFTEFSDSLFLYVLNSVDDKNPFINRLFITKLEGR